MMRARIVLQPVKQQSVISGHPWIFPKAVAKLPKGIRTGELVSVYTAEEQWLGIGVYNSHSLYQIRLLAKSFEVDEQVELSAILDLKLKQAINLRQALGLPNSNTTAYRLVNSEADSLSGLTVDCFDNTYVISSSAFWVQANKSLIIESLKRAVLAKNIIWRAQGKPLSQDGWTLKDSDAEEHSSKVTAEILEAGIRFLVTFDNSQKTGLFLDQRENHQRIAALASGKSVLDLYSYSGGFALHAAKAGAKQVTAVDSSSLAIHQAQYNARLNEVAINFINADARDFLNQAGEYDLVILDPPKLVPSRAHLNRAKNYYRFLHRELFKHMASGSLLMTCNCSSALSSEAFCHLISSQALAVNKQIRLLGVYGPASCHPTLAAFPEGNYLTAVLVAVI